MAQLLELAEVIQALREELIKAQKVGKKKAIRFNLDNIEVEFQTVVEKEVGVTTGGKIKFLVVDADAKASGNYKKSAMHKIKLSLQAVDLNKPDPKTGEPGSMQISGDE
ncbi:MAG: trypco2 family protein [Methylococcales bacterium]